jgi:hypothetical protein
MAVLSAAACGTPPASPAPPAPAAPAVAGSVPAAPALPSPYAGTSLPVPPKQNDPWAPWAGADLSPLLVSDVETLFRQGLADPRGLAYHEVEIAVGDVWSGGGKPVKTTAWVLPHTPSVEQSFVVAWNGLVYPAVSVGPKRDLAADLTAAIHADEEARKARGAEPGSSSFRGFGVHGEAGSSAAEGVSLLRALMAIRAGEQKLGRALWNAIMVDAREGDRLHRGDPYLLVATDWVWALFDRAVCAHMRGDDALALASARALSVIAPRVEAEAKARGFEREKDRDGKPEPHLDFLDRLPALLADQERRAARAGSHEGLDPRAPQKSAGTADAGRIAALIGELDQVAERQWAQPGDVDLAADPRVKALIAEGEAAVDPLIDALEHDDRLTRSVHFHRDFDTHRSLLGVAEAAYAAIAGILDTSFFEVVSTGDDLSGRGAAGRREVAAKIRAYWKKWRGVPIVERWYRILADDTSPAEQWIEAANRIVQPSDPMIVRRTIVIVYTTPTLAPDGTPNPRGEALRARKRPSVTELISRRIDELGTKPASLRDACTLGVALREWDPRGAVPVMARQAKRVRQHLAAHLGDRRLEIYLETGLTARCLAMLTQARAMGGDQTALDEYAGWIRTVKRDDVDGSPSEMLAPLWQSPDRPAVQRAAQALFGAPGAPFSDVLANPGLLGTPLVRLAPYRARVLAALALRSPIGKVSVDEKNVTYTIDGSGGGAMGLDRTDPHAPPAGTKLTIRVCDHVAFQLAETPGAPAFRLYWPEAVRDDALKAMAAFVRAQAGKPGVTP